MTKAQAAAYLAGMIDGEGCVRVRTSRSVSVSSTDWELIEAVVECCELLGLRNRVVTLKHYPPYKQPWEVVINGKDALMSIQKRVPIRCRRKQASLAEAISAYKQLPRPPKDWLEQKYHGEGLSLQEVAEAWGAKNSVSAHSWMKFYGIPRRAAGGESRTKYPRPPREWLEARLAEGRTLQQIGDLVDAPLEAVWRWREHYEIK